jgi:hypothetical protein
LGPLLWLGHNWWWWGDALAFLHGTHAAGATGHYPGSHDWGRAALQYTGAVALCAGWPLVLLGVSGIIVAWRTSQGRPLLLLVPAPLFYIWTIHSAGIRVFVPQLYPYAAYNTRYGLEGLPLLTAAAGALVAWVPRPQRGWMFAVTSGVALLPWLSPSGLGACWKEARDTSAARRAWTQESAEFLRTNYHPGDGVLMSFGDLTGALRQAGVPLHDAVSPENRAGSSRAASEPPPLWALTAAGDATEHALDTPARIGWQFQCVATIRKARAPTIRIWHCGPPEHMADHRESSSPSQASRTVATGRSG